jgi:hypothetical protein
MKKPRTARRSVESTGGVDASREADRARPCPGSVKRWAIPVGARVFIVYAPTASEATTRLVERFTDSPDCRSPLTRAELGGAELRATETECAFLTPPPERPRACQRPRTDPSTGPGVARSLHDPHDDALLAPRSRRWSGVPVGARREDFKAV